MADRKQGAGLSSVSKAHYQSNWKYSCVKVSAYNEHCIFLEGTGFANVSIVNCVCSVYSTKCRHGGFRSSSRRSWMQYHL